MRIVTFCPLAVVTRMVSPSPLIPTWQGQQQLLQASAGYVLALVLVPVRCKQIGSDWGWGLGSRRRGSGSRLFSCWYGSRWHPPRHHGLAQLLELDLNDEAPVLQAAE